jgi:hypothetical protein
MIADIITFAIAHQFVAGLAIGGMGFGGALGIIGWTLGYESAMRTVNGWMSPKIDEAHGDVPNLPPCRERRPFPTTPGRWV